VQSLTLSSRPRGVQRKVQRRVRQEVGHTGCRRQSLVCGHWRLLGGLGSLGISRVEVDDEVSGGHCGVPTRTLLKLDLDKAGFD